MQKKNHFPPLESSSRIRIELTVFERVKARAGGINGGEKEQARVDSHSRSNERDLLEVVELAREVGPCLGSNDYTHDDEKEDREGLDASAKSLEED